jgi:hypothetical protein
MITTKLLFWRQMTSVAIILLMIFSNVSLTAQEIPARGEVNSEVKNQASAVKGEMVQVVMSQKIQYNETTAQRIIPQEKGAMEVTQMEVISKVKVVPDSIEVITKRGRSISVAFKGGLSGNGYYDADKLGGRVGMSLEIPLGRKFSLQTALFYASKGGKINQSFSFSDGQDDNYYRRSSYDVTSNYIQFQLQGLLHIPFRKPGFGLQMAAGPYIAYGIDGRTSHIIEKDGMVTKTHMSTFDESGMDYNRFDAGIAYEINFELKHFLIGAYIEMGLADVYEEVDSGNYFVDSFFNKRNFSIGIGFGYRF